jgi:hypothetical protein
MDTCSPAENGQLRCNGDVVEQCDGAVWAPMIDCSDAGQTCVEIAPGFAVCEDAPVEVPTLGSWATVLLVLILLAASFIRMRRSLFWT